MSIDPKKQIEFKCLSNFVLVKPKQENGEIPVLIVFENIEYFNKINKHVLLFCIEQNMSIAFIKLECNGQPFDWILDSKNYERSINELQFVLKGILKHTRTNGLYFLGNSTTYNLLVYLTYKYYPLNLYFKGFFKNDGLRIEINRYYPLLNSISKLNGYGLRLIFSKFFGRSIICLFKENVGNS